MQFKDIERQALEQWEATQNSSTPRILIGMGTCGTAAGAGDILEALNQELQRTGIQAEVIHVGCIGLCYAEPLMEVIKPGMPGIFYGHLQPELIPEIVQGYLVGDNPRSDLALGTRGGEDIEGIQQLFDLPVLKPQVRIALRNCGNIDPASIYHYIANGGYEGLSRALKMKLRNPVCAGEEAPAFLPALSGNFVMMLPGKQST
jgi:NADH-quinone oxidoreductase subunit F